MKNESGRRRNRFVLAIDFWESENGWNFVSDKLNTGVPLEIVIMRVRSFLKEAEDNYFGKSQDIDENDT